LIIGIFGLCFWKTPVSRKRLDIVDRGKIDRVLARYEDAAGEVDLPILVSSPRNDTNTYINNIPYGLLGANVMIQTETKITTRIFTVLEIENENEEPIEFGEDINSSYVILRKS
jgi:hypothetical protein